MHLPNRRRQQGISQTLVLGAIAVAAIAAYLMWPARKAPPQLVPQPAPPATAAAPAASTTTPPPHEAASSPAPAGNARVSTSQIHMRP